MPFVVETSKSHDVKRANQFDDEDLAKVCAELAKSLQENERLKDRLNALESEKSDLKDQLAERDSELKDTQAMLGQLVVSSKRQPNPIAGPSRRPEPPPKRARSPSLEIVDPPEPPKKQKLTETDDAPPVTTKPRNLAFVSLVRRDSWKLDYSKAKNPFPVRSSSSISMPAPKSVISINTTPSNSPDVFNNAKRTPSLSSSLTSKVVKFSPLEPNGRVKSDKPASQSKSGKANVSREEEESSSDMEYSTSSVATGSPSPKEEKLKSPIKIKIQDVFILPNNTVRQYLKTARTLEITPPPIDLRVPRKFLRLAYGGSDQHLLQFIASDMNPSGPVQRRIVFPMLEMNPAMPCRPGEPGLVFASRHEILSNFPWTLFCKLPSAGPALWLYLGEYENVLCGKMTAAQFKSQTLGVKKEWAKLILRMKAFDVYVSMRARIALRLDGSIPVEDKEIEEELINDEIQAVRNDKGLRVTEEDIIAAFSNGDEGIDIIRMTCVKYDHVFANDMQAKFANYSTLLTSNEKKNEENKGKPTMDKTSPQKHGRMLRSQTQLQPDSSAAEDEINFDAPSDSDGEYVAPSKYSVGPPTPTTTAHGLRPRKPSQMSVSVADYFEKAFAGALSDDEDES